MKDTTSKRATVYFEPAVHKALRMKAAEIENSVSDIVNDAVKLSLREDLEDIEAFQTTKKEKSIPFEVALKKLKANGKI